MLKTITPRITTLPSSAKLGAHVQDDGQTQFLVWAPLSKNVHVHVKSPKDTLVPLEEISEGYFGAVTEALPPGSTYFLKLDGKLERPDPVSRFQPSGVHGVSQVIDSKFHWEDASWAGLPLEKYIIYELHIGTFSKEGNFDGILKSLPHLKELGITAIELMPVAQFPGERNWGYDGVFPFAVQNSYGGPVGLKHFVNACHKEGLAVILDVVYNHLGPEGNYLSDFGPYFTNRYSTPWGLALNFDGPDSNHVRRYFIENALSWVTDYHIDALRLDAVHAICDFSPITFLEELEAVVHAEAERLNRKIYLIPESDLNNSRLIRSKNQGGYGYDAQWNDDFHHSLHTILTGEKTGYYMDFGKMHHLRKSLTEGYVYTGNYSKYRRRNHGNKSKDIEGKRFVVFSQNHDQIGNRFSGDRLSHSLSFEQLKCAAGITLLSPYLPLLFMGEEYGEKAPFQYFISHSDKQLIEAVRKGRNQEFKSFNWEGEAPDPQAEETFKDCKLQWDLREAEPNKTLFQFYKKLIHLRKSEHVFSSSLKSSMQVKSFEDYRVINISRSLGEEEMAMSFNLGNDVSSLLIYKGNWNKIIDSAGPEWGGKRASVPDEINCEDETLMNFQPWSFVVLKKGKGS